MRAMSAKSVIVAAALALLASAGGTTLEAQDPAQAGGRSQSPLLASGFGGQDSVQLQSGEVEIEGTLEVLIEDNDREETVHHFLRTATERLKLHIRPGGSPIRGLESGTVVRARGRRSLGNTLELGSGSGVTTVALASTHTFGDQRVAVILVNFQDNPSAPYGWSDAAAVTFGSVNDFFRENSYGQTGLSGDVFGWFTIPMSGGVCNPDQLASLAEQAATAAGANLNNYSRRVYAFPNNACSWWGLGTVGGYPSRAWINGAYALKVVAHELGHNFGDYHAKSEPCDSSGCTIITYGDDRDIMGLSGIGHLNAYQKERLGWLNYGASPPIQTISAPGTYWIDSLQTPGQAPKALKILKSGSVSYYVETRSQIGFDAGYAGGVIIHTGDALNGNTSIQIDLDRDSSAFDAVLDPGQSFVNEAIGLTVTAVSADSSGAWVTIQMPGATCTMRAPTVTLSPGGTISAQPLAPITMSATVRNNDDAVCAGASFGMGLAAPTGWTWTTDRASVSLSPGASTTAALTVTPSAEAAGTSVATAAASRAGSAGPSGSTSVSIAIAPTPPPTPNPTSDLTVTVVARVNTNSQLEMTATVLNGQVAVSTGQVTFAITGPGGASMTVTTSINSRGVATGKYKLKPRDPRGVYTVVVRATSGSAVGTALATCVY